MDISKDPDRNRISTRVFRRFLEKYPDIEGTTSLQTFKNLCVQLAVLCDWGWKVPHANNDAFITMFPEYDKVRASDPMPYHIWLERHLNSAQLPLIPFHGLLKHETIKQICADIPYTYTRTLEQLNLAVDLASASKMQQPVGHQEFPSLRWNNHERIDFQGIKCAYPKLGDKVTLRYTPLADRKQFWRSDSVVASRVALFRGDTCVGRITYQDQGLVQDHHLSPVLWRIDVFCHGQRQEGDWDVLGEDYGTLVKDDGA